MIYLTPHSEGGGTGQPTPPKLKSLISPWDQCNFIHCCKLSILWKVEQDWTILRGVLAWSAISLYPRHLHSQYMYFGLNMYFLSNTLLNYLLQVPTLAHQVVYWLTCALLGKLWEHLNPPPATPITGLRELIYHRLWYIWHAPSEGGQASPTPVTEILNIALVVLKPMQFHSLL